MQDIGRCLVAAGAGDKRNERTRIRTWNLLIRSQTRYPLRHTPARDGRSEMMRFPLCRAALFRANSYIQ